MKFLGRIVVTGERFLSSTVWLVFAGLLFTFITAELVARGQAEEAFTLALVPMVLVVLYNDLVQVYNQRRNSYVLPAFFVVGQYLFSRQLMGISFLNFPLIAGPSAYVLLFLYYQALSNEARRRFWARTSSFAWPIGVFLTVVLVSGVSNGDVLNRTSPFAFVYFVGAVAFFLLTCLYCDSVESVWRLMLFLVIGACLQIPLAIENGFLQNTFLHNLLGVKIPLKGYVTGTFWDAELFAEYMVILALWGVSLVWFGYHRFLKVVLLFLTSGYIFAGLITNHRAFPAGVAGALILFAVLINLRTRSISQFMRQMAVFVTILICLALLYQNLVPSHIRATITANYLARFSDLTLFGDRAFNRAYIYRAVIDMAPSIPFWGLGVGHLSTLSNRVGFALYSTHSILLWAYMSAGWPGLFSIIFLILYILILAFRSFRISMKSTGRQWWISSVLLVTLLFFSVDQLIVDYVRNLFYPTFVWTVFGMISSLYTLSRDTDDDIVMSKSRP